MEQELKVFSKEEFGQVRTIMVEGEPFFVGKDVAKSLGYERATKAIQDHVDEDDKDEVPIRDSIGRMQNTPVINESGLYALIFGSKLPSAKNFKRWVTSEVLPSIRKTGTYSANDQDEITSAQKLRALELIANCPDYAIEYAARIARPFMDGATPEQPIPSQYGPYRKTFNAERFRTYLSETGLTCADIARRSGMQRHLVNEYKLGKHSPGRRNRDRLCEAIGKPADWLDLKKIVFC